MEFPHPTEINIVRRRRLLVLVALLLVIGWIIYLYIPNEPFYQGRSLGWWLDDYSNPLANVHNLADLRNVDLNGQMLTASQAVVAIGTNAIPTLLKYVQARDSTPGKIFLSAIRSTPLHRARFWTADDKHAAAEAGFMILNKKAAPAAPALLALTKHKDADVRMRAYDSLIPITEDYRSLAPVLATFAHDPDPGNRRKAAYYMQLMIPVLSPDEAQKAGVYEAFPELLHAKPGFPDSK